MKSKPLKYWQEKLLPVYLKTPPRDNPLTQLQNQERINAITKGVRK